MSILEGLLFVLMPFLATSAPSTNYDIIVNYQVKTLTNDGLLTANLPPELLIKIQAGNDGARHAYELDISGKFTHYRYRGYTVDSDSTLSHRSRFVPSNYVRGESGEILKYTARGTPTSCVNVERMKPGDWIITKKTGPTILGYTTVMAQHKELGWVAYFTPSIPASVGPENLGGLPGLILEVKSPGSKITAVRLETIPVIKSFPTCGTQFKSEQAYRDYHVEHRKGYMTN